MLSWEKEVISLHEAVREQWDWKPNQGGQWYTTLRSEAPQCVGTGPGSTPCVGTGPGSTPVCRSRPRITRLGSILPYTVRGRCLLTASMLPNPPSPPHQSWPGLASGRNSVTAHRNLACLLSNRGLYSLLFFLHPTCLVEIPNPFGEGNSLWRLLAEMLISWSECF